MYFDATAVLPSFPAVGFKQYFSAFQNKYHQKVHASSFKLASQFQDCVFCGDKPCFIVGIIDLIVFHLHPPSMGFVMCQFRVQRWFLPWWGGGDGRLRVELLSSANSLRSPAKNCFIIFYCKTYCRTWLLPPFIMQCSVLSREALG